MSHGETYETTTQNGDRFRVRDELPDISDDVAEFEHTSQKIKTQMALLALKMNDYKDWFTPTPPRPRLEPFSPFQTNPPTLPYLN